MNISFEKQTVLITGATRGIGKAMADLFAESAETLILTGTKQKVIEDLNKKYLRKNRKYFRLDFTDRNSVNNFIKELNNITKIDVCINNAGINILDDFIESKESDFDQLLTINLKGPYILSKFVAQKMKEQEYGRIVNITSIWSIITKPKRTLYTLTKKALYGMTQTMAIELAKYNVLVNAVSPGFTLTELTLSTNSDSELKKIASLIPINRLANPIEQAKVVLFMASKENTYIVGQNIVVDGGYTNV